MRRDGEGRGGGEGKGRKGKVARGGRRKRMDGEEWAGMKQSKETKYLLILK